MRLDAALDWFHTGHRDHSGVDWIAVRARRDHPVRAALADGTLESWLLTEEGHQVKVPPALWAGRFLWSEAYSSALVSARVGDQHISGYLIVDANAFTTLIEAGDAAATTWSAPSSSAYVPPYLTYMLTVAKQFDLTEDYNFSRELLAAWIMDNFGDFPAELTMSKNKAQMMATFLSNPRFEPGGNRPAVPQGRDPDPRKPFNGVSYTTKSRRRL
ncbi:MAG: hypothetical protein K2Y56_19565 [Methylobacterium sp.]|nr:hypothetical protein [Methylobacterium sp.]